jgi:folate-binding Fe-S cluster repair protein YgfZ
VHLRKGCYRGQESVAKVHNLGHPPRRLTFLHLDGSNHLLPEETEVTLDDKVVGRVTSLAQHFEMGPIALAVLSRSVPEDSTLMVGRVSASQEVIVPAIAGKAANLPPRSELNSRR